MPVIQRSPEQTQKGQQKEQIKIFHFVKPAYFVIFVRNRLSMPMEFGLCQLRLKRFQASIIRIVFFAHQVYPCYNAIVNNKGRWR